MIKIISYFFILTTLFSVNAYSLQIYRTGKAQDITPTTQSAVCLAGGGSDDGWAQGWNYLLQQSGGGDVVIIRADGRRGGYEKWIYEDEGRHQFPNVNSVTTLVIEKPQDANQADVVKSILNAELIFFAGGDQSYYINWFDQSKLAEAVNYMIYAKKTPVGGTSAGMALLAGIDFSARYPSPRDQVSNISSEDVMNDPTGYFVDLDRRVITAPYLRQVITDTHFSERNREGRLVGFMARAVYNNYQDINYKNIKAIAADENTAACYGSDGLVKVYGSGHVFFLKGNLSIERIQNKQSLDWYQNGDAVLAYAIHGKQNSAVFDLKSWTGVGGQIQSWSVNGQDANAPYFSKR